MNAPAAYFVRFWIAPGGEKRVFDWLDGGHIKDVVAQPGFLWARRYKLAEPNAEGWSGYAMVYGVESLETLNAYFNSEASKRYARERAELGIDKLLKMERSWGALDAVVDR